VNSGLASNAVAKPNSARHGRSRKRRPAASSKRKAPPTQAAASEPRAPTKPGSEPRSPDERPQAPWHPLPLSELLIFVGAIGTAVGLVRSKGGISAGGPTLLAGIAAVMIGTVEVTLREHRGGFRSHTLILSLLPVILFHSAVVLIVDAFTKAPRALNVGLLVVDAALFAFLFKLLRARFQDAQRERTFPGRR
jgi:hypothetical protein